MKFLCQRSTVRGSVGMMYLYIYSLYEERHLKDQWDSLSTVEKSTVCDQL